MINYQRSMGNHRVLSSEDREFYRLQVGGRRVGLWSRKHKISSETEVGFRQTLKEGKEKQLRKY